jgi:hypothetical protein
MVARPTLWKVYGDWRTEMNDPGLKKSEFFDAIESLPGIRAGQPTINEKQERRGYFGISLKENNMFSK